jgi:hypothetical protein
MHIDSSFPEEVLLEGGRGRTVLHETLGLPGEVDSDAEKE